MDMQFDCMRVARCSRLQFKAALLALVFVLHCVYHCALSHTGKESFNPILDADDDPDDHQKSNHL